MLEENVVKLIPPQLFNLVAWISGATDDFERDTTIAESEQHRSIPSSLKPSVFTTLVWDNIDFIEETITGSNITHCVNGIAVQFEHDTSCL
jgi:hypothetical protein